MAPKVVIAGAGGMAREAASWFIATESPSRLIGFLDKDASRHGEVTAGLPVLGGDDWLRGRRDVAVIPAIGAPAVRAALLERLREAGVALQTVVHPSAVLGPRVSLGDGAIIGPGCVLTCDVTVHRGAIVNYGALVGHDGVLGACCFIGPGAQLAGSVRVGRGASVGIGASIIQSVSIGEGAVVGAGSVVIRDVDPGATVVGVPASPIKR